MTYPADLIPLFEDDALEQSIVTMTHAAEGARMLADGHRLMASVSRQLGAVVAEVEHEKARVEEEKNVRIFERSLAVLRDLAARREEYLVSPEPAALAART